MVELTRTPVGLALTKLSRLYERGVTWDGTSLHAATAPYHAHLYQVVDFANNSAAVLLSPTIQHTPLNVDLSMMICQTTLWQCK